MRPYQDAPIGIPTDFEIRESMRRARQMQSYAIRDGLRRLWSKPAKRTDNDALAPDTPNRDI